MIGSLNLGRIEITNHKQQQQQQKSLTIALASL